MGAALRTVCLVVQRKKVLDSDHGKGENKRYPNLERYPDHRVFVNVHRSVTEGGHVPNQIRAGGRPSSSYEEEVLQEVADDPSISVRGIEERMGIPKGIAHYILQRTEMHPFHVQRVQSLLSRDYPERI
ncbi:hypothetical protein EVAR_20985_1 [Eumeta japonica]|uniref:Uncharacterized protein n=1 Tax=Eumeta variegata TaxID=151549 RepID=A0A4C1V744_EUMVA|nr:hypothetical protein EVAR_20985_1 [Eumeta japonica]